MGIKPVGQLGRQEIRAEYPLIKENTPSRNTQRNCVYHKSTDMDGFQNASMCIPLETMHVSVNFNDQHQILINHRNSNILSLLSARKRCNVFNYKGMLILT